MKISLYILPIMQKIIKHQFFFLIVFMSFTIVSCKEMSFYEKSTAIPQHLWGSDFISKGQFNITDTMSRYNIYIVLRHTDMYKYNNIWLNVKMNMPSDSINIQKLNLELGSDQNGWEGTGMDDIWEVRKKINGMPYSFKTNGLCNFEIKQIMRDDPLPYVMSAGLRIEKIQ